MFSQMSRARPVIELQRVYSSDVSWSRAPLRTETAFVAAPVRYVSIENSPSPNVTLPSEAWLSARQHVAPVFSRRTLPTIEPANVRSFVHAPRRTSSAPAGGFTIEPPP